MDDKPVQFKRNKRLIEQGDGSHIGGSLFRKSDEDLINGTKLDKHGLTFLE